MHGDGNDLDGSKADGGHLDVDDALLIKTRLTGLIVPGERRFCKDEVQFCENLEIGQ